LEVVGGGVAGEREVLPALADDLVADGGRDAIGAEAADREVVAVMDKAADGVGDGGELVGRRAWLCREEVTGTVGRRVGEERSIPAGERLHGKRRRRVNHKGIKGTKKRRIEPQRHREDKGSEEREK
jgi:hypothetical protein